MNKIFNKIFPIITLIFALSLTACLTDSDYNNNWIGTKKTQNQDFVEIHLTSSDNSNIVSRAYPVIGRDTTINQFIPVNLLSGPASADLTVTYEILDESTSTVIDSLVNIDGLTYDLTKLTVLNQNSTIVIPKGSSTGYLAIKLNPNNLIGSTFVFGIKIKTISDSKYKLSNLSTGIVKFGPANDWDGNYIVDGTMVDVTNANFGGRYPMHVDLVTQSVTDNAMFDKSVGDFAHGFLNGTSGSYYGSFAPVFKFDPATHKVVSVVNYWGQPAGNTRSAQLDPAGINTFDPDTKTIKVSYWMNQPSVTSPHRTHFVEVYTYVGPR